MTDQTTTDETVETPADEATEQTTPGTEAERDDAETFPRAYVEELRTEAKDRRLVAEEAATRAETYAARLHTALVAATGKLADPSDLPFDEAHLDDADALSAAVDELLARKPHLAARRVTGDAGQGARGGAADSVDLLGLMRSRT